MEEPGTGIILTIWIGIMAFFYPLVLDALQHPDEAHVIAGILTLLGGSIAACIIAILWDKQYQWEKILKRKKS